MESKKTRIKGQSESEEKFSWHRQPFEYSTRVWQTDGRTDRHRPTASTALTQSVARLKS